MDHAHDTVAPRSRTLTLDGLAHRVLEWGEPGAPAVLLLHGLRSYARTWDDVAAALAPDHHVLALDFRGRGESAWDPRREYFTRRYVRDVELLADGLSLQRFGVVGHSMGGAVGYVLAARRPDLVTALVVEDIGPGSSDDTAGAERIRREVGATPAAFDTEDEVRAYWRRIRPDVTDEALASRVANTVRRGDDGRWHWTLDMAGIAAARLAADPDGPVDLWRCVDELRCPTLVLRGGRSDFLPVRTCERMAQRQPRLRWAEVPGAGHYVHDDRPDEFVARVVAFLAEVTP